MKTSEIAEAGLLHEIDSLDPKEYIIVKGARVNSLKNVSVAIPRNTLTVITGLSGSGKSSLAFDTLFAEGQRMYVESLSAYARQFLGRMEKPDVDYIRGVSPAIAVEQRVTVKNPRSKVGTVTEVYDYLKLLFTGIGKTYSPVSGKEVKRHTITDVVDYIQSLPEKSGYMVLAPLLLKKSDRLQDILRVLLQKGFSSVWTGSERCFIEDLLQGDSKKISDTFFILIDRNVVSKEEEAAFRMSDSVQTAFFEGHGICFIQAIGGEVREFSDRFEADGIAFEQPSLHLFSFNNPYGACKRCEGFGKVLGIDEDLVIPDKSLSVYEGAIAPWRTERMKEWLDPLLKKGALFDFPIHRSYQDLSKEERKLLWSGNEHFEGLDAFFRYLESKTYEVQYRVMLSRYRGRTVCPDCSGTGLRKDASYVKINKTSITDLMLMPVTDLIKFFNQLKLSKHDAEIADRVLKEIRSRLEYLAHVGLGYLTLNRQTSTLSGGEFQRVKLAVSLGSALVGSMYILDEPSIGLHPRDTSRLVNVLQILRDLGNTVIVVEHEEEIIRAADCIIDIGPEAGSQGGEVVFQGTLREMLEDIGARERSHTALYMSGVERIEVPSTRRIPKDFIVLKGAREHNLKNIDVRFPTGVLSVVTGVSGSGKSTLVREVFYPALQKAKGEAFSDITGKFDALEGNIKSIARIEFVDQNPIGKSSRSNPATYLKVYDSIRQLMAEQPLAKARGYKPSHFSFNVEGGRCEVCQGEGVVKIEMQFMADIHLRCESCNGQRFKKEVLEITYKGKNIHEILELTVDDSLNFFKEQKRIADKLQPLADVGLGYVRLGQSSDTLSGGEAQRVKLASFLDHRDKQSGIFFIFDEPTTGLHFHDIKKLLDVLNRLVDQGNTVLIIEHNTEVIKSADFIIDLGPEGGEQGGIVTFEGTPEHMIALKDNHTARYLKEKL